MAGFREDFYARIGRDYHENMENSFLYGYVKTKRENNLRLCLKEEYYCLADTAASRKKYVRFLVKALLSDKSLQKLLDSISFAAEGLDEASRLAMRSELETELEAVKHAEGKSCGDRLRMLDKYMDKCQASESVIGIDADIESLRHISSELLDSFELRRRIRMWSSCRLTWIFIMVLYRAQDTSEDCWNSGQEAANIFLTRKRCRIL